MSGASYVLPIPPLPAPPPAPASPAVPLSSTASPQPSLAAGTAPRGEHHSAATQYDRTRAQAQQAAPAASAASNGNSGTYGGTGQTNLNENYTAGIPVSNVAQQGSSNPVANAVSVDAVDELSAQPSDSAVANAPVKPLPTLPSHLPVRSLVSAAKRQLALDTAGALFRSDDAGVTWQPVLAQWTGRAIRVALVPATNGRLLAKSLGGLTNPPAAAKSAAAPFTPETFQLTTDAGALWTSADGQTWTRK